MELRNDTEKISGVSHLSALLARKDHHTPISTGGGMVKRASELNPQGSSHPQRLAKRRLRPTRAGTVLFDLCAGLSGPSAEGRCTAQWSLLCPRRLSLRTTIALSLRNLTHLQACGALKDTSHAQSRHRTGQDATMREPRPPDPRPQTPDPQTFRGRNAILK